MSNSKLVNIAVLGSGKGSNFLSIAKAVSMGELPARICVVVSDNPEALIIKKATELGIPTAVLPRGKYKTWLEPWIEEELVRILKKYHSELVVLAGFMRVLKETFLNAFEGRTVNIHPSLLPAFKGKEAWKAALEACVTETGCTIHWVSKEVDGGKIIAQSKVPVLPGDTSESLHARIQQAEHELYPKVLKDLCLDWIKKYAK
ncbi:phosphoribosylglycinamide formyltransferase [Candidatus Methylacidiphilum fumarolicum]|uniref:Phosphoribosylglycinamide formyltransferase n=2 Tax=Candidatus Methylacidiphilum fumarolicum TaxID=591154 RepID=I0JX36_METFB|nr:phosphoribosylglycinamide formyltransferase [Candidatus Methylacidiphilum fumarolicum]MBW6414492.1 phosphoribosylglycinamide formyltransferase [Candidatus Methylacidiphilum fumarolicum]TFE67289.1 phosphoribosylglycinamide formyltransferase [Candidatus Methylacidiphilum fumarolicum]TFE72400.1 phosphoribosylglycinamide formyltransferase [Candidatus Methylacidiphilum fumarolicum]TFE75837.1 phosphoribosylglycinamide formyltransferase [Candidatus Methylacidiphilum fumarolicum]TFE77769.1 phosphor